MYLLLFTLFYINKTVRHFQEPSQNQQTVREWSELNGNWEFWNRIFHFGMSQWWSFDQRRTIRVIGYRDEHKNNNSQLTLNTNLMSLGV